MKNADYPPNIQKQLQKIADQKLAVPFDTVIIPMIAALWALGFSTKNSCAGHEDRHGGGPFVLVSCPGWQDFEKTLHASLLPGQRITENKESLRVLDVYKARNLQEHAKLIALLEEFYANRDTAFRVRLVAHTEARAATNLECQGADAAYTLKNQEQWLAWLAQAQAEFAAFTTFLLVKAAQK